MYTQYIFPTHITSYPTCIPNIYILVSLYIYPTHIACAPTHMLPRLKAIRELANPGGDGKMEFLIVSALVQMSKGRRTIRPFGAPASYSTQKFNEVPSPLFGMALAAMYIFIKLDQSKWKLLLCDKNKKGTKHPITDLWHQNDVYRSLNVVLYTDQVRP